MILHKWETQQQKTYWINLTVSFHLQRITFPVDKKEIRYLRETVINIVFPDRKIDEQGIIELELNREQFRRVFEECSGIKDMKEGGVDLDLVFESVDTNQNGKVSFSEIVLWLGLYKRGTVQEKLKRLFSTFQPSF